MITRIAVTFILGMTAIAVPTGSLASEEPALPSGLAAPENDDASDTPALPAGLADQDDSGESDAPALPGGLEEENDDTSPALSEGLDFSESSDKPLSSDVKQKKTFLQSLKDAGISGFIETRGGVRTQKDSSEKQASIGEVRMQLEWEKDTAWLRLKFTGDLIYDQVDNRLSDVNLRKGTGWFDLREAWAGFSPTDWMDVKIGQQVLTWGTGDLLFVNDMFPKDWRAFFIGRDLEYLKAPTDAIKISAYNEIVNTDFVYIPLMTPSRYISGRRLSYYNPNVGEIVGRDDQIDDYLPDKWFSDAEYAARLYRKIGSYELAAYGYSGFYNTPEGFNVSRNKAFYPRLNTYGGSIRGPLGRGIGNFEGAYYDSREDRKGDNPLIPNSQIRLLAGYQMDLPEIAKELTVGVQYYVELMMDYSQYRDALPSGSVQADEARHVITFRITKQLMNQNLTLDTFVYYSPSDNDAYFRPHVKYKINDFWTAEAGGNIFIGSKPNTFFGQFRRDSNIYVSLRYAF